MRNLAAHMTYGNSVSGRLTDSVKALLYGAYVAAQSDTVGSGRRLSIRKKFISLFPNHTVPTQNSINVWVNKWKANGDVFILKEKQRTNLHRQMIAPKEREI